MRTFKEILVLVVATAIFIVFAGVAGSMDLETQQTLDRGAQHEF